LVPNILARTRCSVQRELVQTRFTRARRELLTRVFRTLKLVPFQILGVPLITAFGDKGLSFVFCLTQRTNARILALNWFTKLTHWCKLVH